MFAYSNFNQPINNWNVNNVTNMYRMFRNAQSFDQDISSWNVSNVKTHKNFSDWGRLEEQNNPFTQNTDNLGDTNSSNPTGKELLQGAGNENGAIDVNQWHGEGMSYGNDRHTLVDNGITYLGANPLSDNGGMYQAISTEVGKTYKVTATLIGANHYKPNELHDFTLGSSYISVDTDRPTPDSETLESTHVIGNTPTIVEIVFDAVSTTTYISLRSDKAFRYPKASRISVKEVQ